MPRTLLQLRNAVRQRADMENSTFVADVELNDYINSSLAELYDLIVTEFEDYFLSSATVTIATGSNSLAFPIDAGGNSLVYKVRGLDYQLDSSTWVTIRPFQFAERNAMTLDRRRGLYAAPLRTYRIGPTALWMLPEADASGTYRLWYVPVMTPLVADTDTLALPQYWDEYAVCDAAIKCLQKEESDVSVLAMQKASLVARIQSSASKRDAGEGPRVADVNMDEFFPSGWWP